MSDDQGSPGRRKIRLHLTWRYLIGFAALTLLCGTSHEFAHHFSGAAICGKFGYKTFNSFELAPGCDANPISLWATAAGPLFTFGLMWWGLFLLRSDDERGRNFGFALIFANFPINRLLFILIHSNDEQWVAYRLYGHSNVAWWVAIAVVWLACVPPLVVAYRAIGNRRRWLWFTGFFVLPFLYVILFAGLFLENYLLLGQRFLANTILGIPLLIILIEILSLLVYHVFREDLRGVRRHSQPPVAAG